MTAKKMNWIESWWITLNMKMKKLRSHDGRIFKMYVAAFFLSLPGIVVFAQTNSEHTRRDNSVYAELAKAPKKAAARHNPLQADPDAVAAGGKLFALHCAECHGDMAEGGKKAPSLLAPEVQQATPGTYPLLAVDQRRGPPRHAGVVQTP